MEPSSSLGYSNQSRHKEPSSSHHCPGLQQHSLRDGIYSTHADSGTSVCILGAIDDLQEGVQQMHCLTDSKKEAILVFK